ncbi:MAG: hypothetical protein JKY48_05600 [Flavobacteriales bacterium]|nr:hypothetical protein [Flavobacteriales bacterium]
MKYFFLFLSCLLVQFVLSQNVYPLHPSVGDTIDINEKLDYSLFSVIDNNGFQYATIGFEKNAFKLSILIIKIEEETELEIETSYTLDLTQAQIIEEQQKIQKVNAYYKYLAEEAKKPKIEPSTSPQKSLPIRFESAMSEKMKKEVRMNLRLKEDSRRMQEFEMGLRPRELRLEFK